MSQSIFLDYNSTTPILGNVKRKIFEIIDAPLNASSVHRHGKFAKKIIDECRAKILEISNCDKNFAVIFTSSGTEANNLAINGLRHIYKPVTTCVEHSSVLSVVGEGLIGVDSDGIVKLDELRYILEVNKSSGSKTLVSIQFANNETGVIQPIKTISKICKEFNAVFHVDATQAFGKVKFNAIELGVDLFTITAHKFGGGLGAAALVVKKDLPLNSIMKGGGQEQRFRPGTQNTYAIAGMSEAITHIDELTKKQNEIIKLRDYIESEITSISNEVIIFGKESERLKNTSSIYMPNVLSETQVIFFDTNGISLSAGAACSSGTISMPHVQLGMGYALNIAKCALRVSLGYETTLEEAQKFVELWKELYFKNNEKGN